MIKYIYKGQKAYCNKPSLKLIHSVFLGWQF